MIKRQVLWGTVILCFGLGCRGPQIDLKGTKTAPEANLSVTVEDHSRSLKRLRDLQPGETNSPEARKAALEAHRAQFETRFQEAASNHGLVLSPDAPWRLELTITSLGEVRSKYIVYGIASGVAWGVGTGLVAHSTKLAIGLGTYELLEESAFWILGASMFGSYSAPVVVEARLIPTGQTKATWSETYYVLNGRKKLKSMPSEIRRHREIQLQASLDKAIEKIFKDLETMMVPRP
jgi:hypothetical protein